MIRLFSESIDSDHRSTMNQSPMRDKTTLSEKREFKMNIILFILIIYLQKIKKKLLMEGKFRFCDIHST
jgi:hypothetical protein